MLDKQPELSMRWIRRVHLVGIGGAGMGGIAEVLHNLGYQVSGSDLSQNAMVQHLKNIGITILNQHTADNIINCDVVVVSSAIAADNIELVTARTLRIPIVQRATMLAELMRFKEGIAIAGTHGKTTTTSLVASVIAEGGLDPTFVVGGRLNHFGTNAKLGAGRYFVAEADESDASFLQLMPMIAVVTNIDKDHLETYQHDFSLLKNAYLQFLHRLPFYGLAIVCIDDPETRSILSDIARPLMTYGFSIDADIRAHQFSQNVTQSTFEVLRKNRVPLAITLNLPGRHNALNALAAIAVASEAGIEDTVIQRALFNFQGVGRRFQLLGTLKHQDKQVLIVDDYGHHPREIETTIAAAREAWPTRRLVMIFQPHRYTRTKALFEDFATVLSEVDVLVLLDVYSAGEAVIVGADGRTLAFSIRNRGKLDPIFVPENSDLFHTLSNILEHEDILVMQGAGDIGALALDLAKTGLARA
jgi:UDP-N-acetylmuramate--alanine ligase